MEAGEARRSGSLLAPFDNTPLARVEWSGDFVEPVSRTSIGFVFGSTQTNAGFFAKPFRVSIAVGLLFARDRCRNLCVRTDSAPPKEWAKICAGSQNHWRITRRDPLTSESLFFGAFTPVELRKRRNRMARAYLGHIRVHLQARRI